MAPINRNPMMTLERARELFHYDPEDGELVSISNEGRRSVGTVYDGAGSILVDGEWYQVTRICWFLYYGKWPNELIDHRNRIDSDNRISNLREATHTQNQQNKIQLGATGYPGVTKRNRPKPYLAKIRVDGRRINLGSFLTAEEAAEAYAAAKRKYHGEFSPI